MPFHQIGGITDRAIAVKIIKVSKHSTQMHYGSPWIKGSFGPWELRSEELSPSTTWDLTRVASYTHNYLCYSLFSNLHEILHVLVSQCLFIFGRNMSPEVTWDSRTSEKATWWAINYPSLCDDFSWFHCTESRSSQTQLFKFKKMISCNIQTKLRKRDFILF